MTYTPQQNSDIILAIYNKNILLFIKAVRSNQSLRGRSGLLRFSNDPKLNQMIKFVDTMDSKDGSREHIADILEQHSFSEGEIKTLCRYEPTQLEKIVQTLKPTRKRKPL